MKSLRNVTNKKINNSENKSLVFFIGDIIQRLNFFMRIISVVSEECHQ